MQEVIIQIRGYIEDDITDDDIKNKIYDSDICDIETIAIENIDNDLK